MRRHKILIYAPAPVGGIAEHIFYQATALSSFDADVICLASPGFLPGKTIPFACKRKLIDPLPVTARGTFKRIRQVYRLVFNEVRLALEVLSTRPNLVFLDSFREYLSPIWVWPHFILSKLGLATYAANLHDPIRDYRVGPLWWHRLSVWVAYSPLDFVVIHQQLPDLAEIPPRIKLVEARHGIYPMPQPRESHFELRRKWGVMGGQRVFLCFGYLRNNKRIDLVLKAMVDVPSAFLVVLGQPASSHDNGIVFYQTLASDLRIAERTYMSETFVADDEITDIFAAADFVVLVYAESFVSQSGVLSIAAGLRKSVLASSGDGPLRTAVESYNLGIFVKPASVTDVARAMKLLISGQHPTPRWEEYEKEASWVTNAKQILAALEHDDRDEPSKLAQNHR